MASLTLFGIVSVNYGSINLISYKLFRNKSHNTICRCDVISVMSMSLHSGYKLGSLSYISLNHSMTVLFPYFSFIICATWRYLIPVYQGFVCTFIVTRYILSFVPRFVIEFVTLLLPLCWLSSARLCL